MLPIPTLCDSFIIIYCSDEERASIYIKEEEVKGKRKSRREGEAKGKRKSKWKKEVKGKIKLAVERKMAEKRSVDLPLSP